MLYSLAAQSVIFASSFLADSLGKSLGRSGQRFRTFALRIGFWFSVASFLPLVNCFPSCVPLRTSKGHPMFVAVGGEIRDLPAVWSLVCDSAGPEVGAELSCTAMKQWSGFEAP